MTLSAPSDLTKSAFFELVVVGDVQADMLRILDREGADAAGAGVDQDALAGAGADLPNPCSVVSPPAGARPLRMRDARRLERNELFGKCDLFSEGTNGLPRRSHIDRIARLESPRKRTADSTTPLASNPKVRGN
jgi:hypothetical protein